MASPRGTERDEEDAVLVVSGRRVNPVSNRRSLAIIPVAVALSLSAACAAGRDFFPSDGAGCIDCRTNRTIGIVPAR